MKSKKKFSEESGPVQDESLEQAKKSGELKLLEPIKWGEEETISVLKFRKAKGKDFRRLPMEPDTGDVMNLTARLTGQAPGLIDELGADDLMRALEVTSHFLGVGQKIGKRF